MSNAAQSNAAPRQHGDARARRLLFIAHSPAGEALAARLSGAGYEVRAARAGQAGLAIRDFAPHVALVEAAAAGGGSGATAAEEAGLEFAVRLRAEEATAALPLVLLFDRADAGLRAQAVRLGADDYFALATPPAEIAARLDALFWRAEAGRRPASLAALERRAEIDDFMQLLEGVRADIDAGSTGALALVAATRRAPGETSAAQGATTPDTQSPAAAHDFFRLNLRRVDSVAFYGPTLLLVYLPHKTAGAAGADLARLSEEFQQTQPHGVSLEVGLASFPSDGTEIESLIEQAEAALQPANSRDAGETPETSRTHQPSADPEGDDAPAPSAARDSGAGQTGTAAGRNARASVSPSRPVRESKQTDMETSMMPAGGGGASAGVGQGTLSQAAADAAARERERRTRGAHMPRRLLLTVSDPARMAQTNLLLRSAGYEVRAAFDGLQAINLLRIERPDLLVIDDALYGIDGLEALRRLHRQHHERLPLPVVLLLSNAPEMARVRAEAGRLGVRGFVAMPYDPEELLISVRTVGITD